METKQPTFSNLENTRIANTPHGWEGMTKVKVNGKNWILSTMKRYNGTISTNCHAVQDEGNGNYSFMLFSGDESEDFYLNVLPKGTRATEKVIKEAHFKSLALFDAKNEAGELPKAENEYKIEVGQIIFTDHPMGNMSESRRAIYKIEDSNFGRDYHAVLLDGSRTETSRHIRNYKKKFGIGTYFNEGERIDQAQIDALLISATENMKQEAAKEEAQSIIDKAQAEKKANYLSQFKRADRRETTNIIKRHILKTWPTVQKVEIKTDAFSGGDSMDVKYFAPAEIDDLETFVKSFQYGHFNGMEDLYEYSDSEEIILEGHILQTYKYVSAAWQEATEAPNFEAVEVKTGTVQIIDYSEKAIAVIGDTKPIKDKLKALGGSFNFRLTCGAGWIFPKTKLTELQTALA